jgi:hypothetical protein
MISIGKISMFMYHIVFAKTCIFSPMPGLHPQWMFFQYIKEEALKNNGVRVPS